MDSNFSSGQFSPDEYVINREELVSLVLACEADKASGKYKSLTTEGSRIASEFRKLFPDVSDKDMGTIIIVFCRVLSVIAETRAMFLTTTLERAVGTYSYAGAEIIKGALDLDTL